MNRRHFLCTLLVLGDLPRIARAVVPRKNMQLVAGPSFFPEVGWNGRKWQLGYADVWSQPFENRCRETFDAFCKMNSDYSERILCAPGPTPIWDLTQARLQHEMDWVSFIRQLPADAPGKRRYITFLLERYRHQFHTINQLYGSRARQGEDLLEYPFAKVSWQDPQIFRDDRWFLGEIEQQFQKVNFQIYRGLSPQFLLQLPDIQAVPQSKSRIAEYGKIIL